MPQILGSSIAYRIAVGPQQGRKAFIKASACTNQRIETEPVCPWGRASWAGRAWASAGYYQIRIVEKFRGLWVHFFCPLIVPIDRIKFLVAFNLNIAVIFQILLYPLVLAFDH